MKVEVDRDAVASAVTAVSPRDVSGHGDPGACARAECVAAARRLSRVT